MKKDPIGSFKLTSVGAIGLEPTTSRTKVLLLLGTISKVWFNLSVDIW